MKRGHYEFPLRLHLGVLLTGFFKLRIQQIFNKFENSEKDFSAD